MRNRIFTGIVSLFLVVAIMPLSVLAETDCVEGNNDAFGGIKPQNSASIYYKFVEKSKEWDYTSAKELILSDDITGTGEFTVTKTKSTTFEYSGTLTSAEHSAIVKGASVSIGVTLTNAISVTINKNKKETGHLAFQPYRQNISGTLKTYNSAYSQINGGLIQTRTISDIKYPAKGENGKARGNYYVHYARLH